MLDGFEPTIWPLDMDIPFVSNWSRRERRPRSLINHSLQYGTNVAKVHGDETYRANAMRSSEDPRPESVLPFNLPGCQTEVIPTWRTRSTPSRREANLRTIRVIRS